MEDSQTPAPMVLTAMTPPQRPMRREAVLTRGANEWTHCECMRDAAAMTADEGIHHEHLRDAAATTAAEDPAPRPRGMIHKKQGKEPAWRSLELEESGRGRRHG
jgi:hypothetical protein